jgi:hypothetical protein
VLNGGGICLLKRITHFYIVNWLYGVPASFSLNLANVELWCRQQTGVSILITMVLYDPVWRNQLVAAGQRESSHDARDNANGGRNAWSLRLPA